MAALPKLSQESKYEHAEISKTHITISHRNSILQHAVLVNTLFNAAAILAA